MRTDLKLLIAVADAILELSPLPLSTGNNYEENDMETTDFVVNSCPFLCALTHNKTTEINEIVASIAADIGLATAKEDLDFIKVQKTANVQKVSNISRVLLLLGKNKLLAFKEKLKKLPEGTDELLQVILKTTQLNPKFVRKVILNYVRPPKENDGKSENDKI